MPLSGIRAAQGEAWRAELVRPGREHVRQHTWNRAAWRLREAFADVLAES